MLDTITPDSETAIAETIRDADGPLRIVGGGTRPIGGAREGQELSTTGLSGITLYEPGALTLVARAGTPVSEIEAALAGEGQDLPFEPMDHRGVFGTSGAPTIGGVVATGASGPRRVRTGAVRDFLIGLRFVDGSGEIVKNGGRVMKNVTGYDLVKLLCGSHGTLGVITEVSFKVLPTAKARASVVLDGLDPAKAVEAMAAAMSSPFEVTGAAHDPETRETMLRLEGFESQVEYRTGELQRLLQPFGTARIERDTASVEARWAAVRDVAFAHGGDDDLWRISVRPSDGSGVLAALPGARCLMDWAGGLVWAAAAPGTDIRAKLAGIAGHATLVRASSETVSALGTFHPEPEPLSKLSAGLRAKFDPRGILNPGLMG